jgi:hypothetical protein
LENHILILMLVHFRILHDKELRVLCRPPITDRIAKYTKIRWARMGETKNVYRTYVGNLLESGNLEDRKVDNIKIDQRELCL